MPVPQKPRHADRGQQIGHRHRPQPERAEHHLPRPQREGEERGLEDHEEEEDRHAHRGKRSNCAASHEAIMPKAMNTMKCTAVYHATTCGATTTWLASLAPW